MLAQSRDPLRGDNPLKHPRRIAIREHTESDAEKTLAWYLSEVLRLHGVLDAAAGHDEAARLRLARRSRWPGLYPSHGPSGVLRTTWRLRRPEETLE